MGVLKFEIEVLQKSILHYFPGETVEGILHVVTEEEIKTKGISITFGGRATVRWTEKHNNRTTIYWNEEYYFNQKFYLFGKGEMDVTLPGGMHQFPFRFTLPMGIPSSYANVFGQVTYEMKAEMQRSWLLNRIARVPFGVTGILDLNIEPGATQSTEISKSKTLCCLYCKSGPIGFILRMPKTGHVPGEYIQFSAEFSNQSNRRVKGVKASLVQNVQYHTLEKTNYSTYSLCSVPGPAVEPGESENWSGNILQIPPIVPTRLATCRIIDVQYCLKIEMDLAGPSINLRQEIPIIIGNIPLRNLYQEMTVLQPKTTFPIASLFDAQSPPPDTAFPAMLNGTSTQYEPSKYEGGNENQGFTYSNSVSRNTGLGPSTPLESIFTVSFTKNYN